MTYDVEHPPYALCRCLVFFFSSRSFSPQLSLASNSRSPASASCAGILATMLSTNGLFERLLSMCGGQRSACRDQSYHHVGSRNSAQVIRLDDGKCLSLSFHWGVETSIQLLWSGPSALLPRTPMCSRAQVTTHLTLLPPFYDMKRQDGD